jgi:hypothetical protein
MKYTPWKPISVHHRQRTTETCTSSIGKSMQENNKFRRQFHVIGTEQHNHLAILASCRTICMGWHPMSRLADFPGFSHTQLPHRPPIRILSCFVLDGLSGGGSLNIRQPERAGSGSEGIILTAHITPPRLKAHSTRIRKYECSGRLLLVHAVTQRTRCLQVERRNQYGGPMIRSCRAGWSKTADSRSFRGDQHRSDTAGRGPSLITTSRGAGVAQTRSLRFYLESGLSGCLRHGPLSRPGGNETAKVRRSMHFR